jgi:hypothetical protein
MKTINYSDGRAVPSVIVIWEDLHNAGYYRAFWASSPDADGGSPVIGYCSVGGSHRSVKDTAREALRYHPGETVFRNGRPVKL